jgi:hypothetical protein
MSLKRAVNQRPLSTVISPENFTPRGKGDLPEEASTEFRIPAHQRFPSWPLSKKRKLVDSVLRNYPIHAVIATRQLTNAGLDVIEYCDIEDGQTRLTALQEYYMDEFACESGPDSIGNGKKFSELSPAMQQNFMNYQVTLEIFSGRNITHDDIAEIFNRLNSGKPLGDNDKFYSRMKTPVLKLLDEVKNHSDLRSDFNRFIGPIGCGKTRKGLSDMVGAILAVATKNGEHGGRACINTSYELNHRYLGADFTAEQIADVIAFFGAYFEMLRGAVDSTTRKPRKIFGKLSGILGLAVYSWITNGITIHPAIKWYTSMLVHDPKYEPNSFRQLTKGDIRNCQGDSVYRRLCKIIEQWEYDMSAAQNRTTPYLIITSNPEDGMSVSNSSDEEDDEEEEEEAEESR